MRTITTAVWSGALFARTLCTILVLIAISSPRTMAVQARLSPNHGPGMGVPGRQVGPHSTFTASGVTVPVKSWTTSIAVGHVSGGSVTLSRTAFLKIYPHISGVGKHTVTITVRGKSHAITTQLKGFHVTQMTNTGTTAIEVTLHFTYSGVSTGRLTAAPPRANLPTWSDHMPAKRRLPAGN